MMLKCDPAENRSDATVFPNPVFIVQLLASSLVAHLCVDDWLREDRWSHFSNLAAAWPSVVQRVVHQPIVR